MKEDFYRKIVDYIIENQNKFYRLAYSYVRNQEDALPDITEETSFYMNEAGNPVIVFEPYEVAPGSAGVQEFEIKAR